MNAEATRTLPENTDPNQVTRELREKPEELKVPSIYLRLRDFQRLQTTVIDRAVEKFNQKLHHPLMSHLDFWFAIWMLLVAYLEQRGIVKRR